MQNGLMARLTKTGQTIADSNARQQGPPTLRTLQRVRKRIARLFRDADTYEMNFEDVCHAMSERGDRYKEGTAPADYIAWAVTLPNSRFIIGVDDDGTAWVERR